MKQRFAITILVDTENEDPVSVTDIDECMKPWTSIISRFIRTEAAATGCIGGCLVQEITSRTKMRESAGIVHERFMGKECIWLVGIGQGVIYIYSYKAVSENTQCMILAQCFPADVRFVVCGHPIEEFLQQIQGD